MAGREFYNWIREIAAGIIANTVTGTNPGPVSEDERAALFLTLQELPSDAAAVLWRRHREAIGRRRENHFVRALSKIPSAQRREAFIKLSQVTDQDFEQALVLLAPQSGPTGEAVRRFGDELGESLKQLDDATAKALPQMQKRIEEAKARVQKKLEERKRRGW
jgi:hypothetical protein